MPVSAQDVPEETPPQARNGFTGGIASLADDRLYALQNSFALDGRVSSYPASARGFSVANSYLLTQPDAAMLIDTGFGKDEPVIRAQIEQLIAPGLPLSMFPLRLNEFMSINNVESFAAHFNIDQCYTSNPDAALWFDFGAKPNGRSILDAMKVTAVTRADKIELGKSGRAIDVMQAPLRLIATRWLYDHTTRTLFSSDMFTHVWRDSETGPWIVTDTDDDPTSLRDVRSFMLNTRYWWVEGVSTDSMRRGIGDIFDKHDIQTIAPGYGCILRGRKVVARHYGMLDEFLEGLRQERGGVALYLPRRGAVDLRRLVPLQEAARAVDGTRLQLRRGLPRKHRDLGVRRQRGDGDRHLERMRGSVVGQHQHRRLDRISRSRATRCTRSRAARGKDCAGISRWSPSTRPAGARAAPWPRRRGRRCTCNPAAPARARPAGSISRRRRAAARAPSASSRTGRRCNCRRRKIFRCRVIHHAELVVGERTPGIVDRDWARRFAAGGVALVHGDARGNRS